jgi:hypothetical protein
MRLKSYAIYCSSTQYTVHHTIHHTHLVYTHGTHHSPQVLQHCLAKGKENATQVLLIDYRYY